MSIETGRLAPLADGAVVVQIGDTTLLSTVVTSKPREGIDFFPLTVDVEERMYAAGKIPGSFFRREGRPGEQAILTCRLTDRPLRPSFPDDFRNEVQVIATILGADLENPHDIASINGASAALMISGIPFNGPIGAVRIAHIDGEWVAHPTYQQGDEATFEMVVAGRQLHDGDVAIMMVEAGGTDATWKLYEDGAPKITEDVIADGLEWCKQWVNASINLQLELIQKVQEANGPLEEIAYEPRFDYDSDAFDAVADAVRAETADAMAIADKTARNVRLDEIESAVVAELAGADDAPFADRAGQVKKAFRALQKQVVRTRIVEEGVRIDGRSTTDIRALSADIGIIPTAHGTGLFQRGETQVLSVATLGMPRMEQMLDTIGVDDRKRYMHHYNFPPFSTGETGRVGSPKRREIGHGALAERALVPVLPTREEFPYAIRQVSEAIGSNGSTSMGSVCASTMALLDAGVPLKDMVAGIAMGLIHEDGEYVTLTDILGAEDAFGDMDFKVAGTKDVITALQLDTKLDGIPASVLAAALTQARAARLTVLEVMRGAITEPGEMSVYAPRIITIKVPVDKIGEVIGPKGKMINSIQDDTGAEITIEDDGTIYVGATDGPSAEAARAAINAIANQHMPEVGERFLGTVVKTTTFGAFVSLLPGKDGLLHITQIRKLHGGKRIENIDDVVHIGDKIQVEIREVDDRGKLSLVPVEVVEREAAEGTPSDEGSGPGRDKGERNDHRGAPGQGGGDRDGHRTRHRERRHRDS